VSNTGGTGGALDFGDVGIEGDGDRMISSPFVPDAANSFSNAPVGHMFTFQMMSADSTIFPGIKGPFTRDVWVYVPSQYVPGTPAPLMVMQDGGWAVWLGDNEPHMSAPGTPNLPGTANLPRVLDNLIAAGELPPIVAIFPNNGGGDAEGSERGLEYDTVSGKYAEWAEMELLPRVSMEAQTQLNLDLQFTTDPRGRATMGGSSGGAASFSAAWWHPDYFARVISFSGTFVRQASPEDPMFPHGCWSYHDFDPYDEAMPNGVIMMSDVKPLRIWLEVGSNDMGSGSGPGSYRDFRLANQRMAASLKAKGYHYHFDLANGAGHVDGNVVAQTLPEAMKWLWRGYPL
jgi:enterochelin esterase-like enzyme